MPPETHFFPHFFPDWDIDLLCRHTFPLSGEPLMTELRSYSRIEPLDGLDVEPEAIYDDLDGSASSVLEMFESVVRVLSEPARVLGEKTPGHLLWWRPIASADPLVKFILCIRDPRAVVASNLAMKWSEQDIKGFEDAPHLPLAARWQFEQDQAVDLADALGPRCQILRYEDVVAEPSEARQKLRVLISPAAEPREASTKFILPWEDWKRDALGAVNQDRVSAWSDSLTPTQAAEVSALCRRGMERFGYTQERRGRIKASRTRRALGNSMSTRLGDYLKSHANYVRYIEHLRF